MSLTSELNDSNSPLSRFMARELPATSRITGSVRSRLPLRPRTVTPQAAQRPDYRSLGRAIDRRLRIAFGSPVDSVLLEGVFYAGIDVAEVATRAAGQAVHGIGQTLLSELKAQPAAHDGTMTRSRRDEERLSRLCFAASHFEEVKRAGLRPGNPLLQLDARAVLDDLLDQVPSYVPDDIAAQVELAEADHALGWVTRQPVDKRICAPVFSGSNDVDGADADYIAEGHLIDCKATTRPDRFGSRKEVHQLAGYLLLDYQDEYALDKVGFYLSRQGQLVTWSTQDFLDLLGARRSLSELRAALSRTLRAPALAAPPQREKLPPHATQDSLFDEEGDTE
ncbi:hypothetical protein ACFVGP_03495 [Streptomyces rochei]|uniref:hypothetical protein n=1 Tax=Streptomyces TaxID=1883 RepID=UPI000F749792|nr:hypothetical protein [Streptomyces sp. WAC06273]RSS63147.1 hypothetical protein EF907_29665 [Streptomyces sp. WAC06273]